MSRTLTSRFSTTAKILLLLAQPVLIPACASTNTSTDRQTSARTSTIIALIDGQAITRDSIWDSLAEPQGRLALENLVLDRELERRAAQREIRITPELIQAQRDALIQAWSQLDDQLPADRILEQIRSNRGLGPSRYQQLLRRNALLEALTTPASGRWEPSPNQLDNALEQRFGERFKIRLFVSQSPQDAARLRDQILNSDPASRPWVFSDACAARSIHPSRDRGGLISSISPLDLAYPGVISESLTQTGAGECSQVLSTDSGYVVIYVESIMSPTVPSEHDREQTREQLARDARRLAMQRLREEILGTSHIAVLDGALNWSWTNRP